MKEKFKAAYARTLAHYKSHKVGWWVSIIGAVFMFIYYLPYMILGENSYLDVFDNLEESHIAHIVAAKYFFHFNGTIPELMNVDVRAVYAMSTFSLIFYAIFPPFVAFMLNNFVVRLSAYAGMYLLMNLLLKNKYHIISIATALMYASVGFATQFGLSGAGFPLIIWAVWQIYQKKNLIVCHLVVAYYTLSTAFILSGFFVAPILIITSTVLFGISIYKKYKDPSKSIWEHYHFYIATVVMCVLFVICNLKMAVLMLSDYTAHREMWADKNLTVYGLWYNMKLSNVLEITKEWWTKGHPHIGGNAILPIILVEIAFCIGLALYVLSTTKFKGKMELGTIIYYWKLMCIFFVLSWFFVFSGVYTKAFFSSDIFDLMRFIMAGLSLSFVAGGLALAIIYHAIKLVNIKPQIILSVTSISVIVFVACFEILKMLNYVYSPGSQASWADNIKHRELSYPTYRQFYDKKLFSDIENYIYDTRNESKTDYKTASFAMMPSSATYNGFNTLDGYVQMYTLEYWKKWNAIISQEIKGTPLEAYYNWGNNCILLSRQAHIVGEKVRFNKYNQTTVTELLYNWDAFVDIGGKYIFSAVPIEVDELINIGPAEGFEGEFWRIHVYMPKDYEIYKNN
jgi:hypothetical protein